MGIHLGKKAFKGIKPRRNQIMRVRLYNPPLVLLARGDPKGADIGGALSILAMDKNHNLHVVENIFSELNHATYWQEEGLEEEFENLIMEHMDDEAVTDNQELITRIINSFNTIRRNGWIFYGIASFESNTFVDAHFMDLESEYIERLREAHRRIRNQRHFPVLLEDVTDQSFISCMFHGFGSQFFHYPDNRDLFTIFTETMHIIVDVRGIVCTAQEAANFYTISGNIRRPGQESEAQMDLQTLDVALGFIENDVISPVAWYQLYLGRNALVTLDRWDEIRDNNELRFALRAYLQYVNTILRDEHDKTLR